MNAFFDRILTLNLVGTTVVFYVAARIYLWPHLHRLSPRSVMIPILLLHSLRHLGLMFLTRGATYPGLSREFAWPAALGDLIAALLAFASIFLVCAIGNERDRWCGFSTSGARSTFLSPSRWRPFIARLSSWDRPIGFRRSGFQRCWSRTTSLLWV